MFIYDLVARFTALKNNFPIAVLLKQLDLLYYRITMNTATRKILVTTALTYANGAIHLGHLLEFIQTDIWVRYQKLRGNECYYVGGSDAHGTAVMLQAEKCGLSAEDLITQVSREQLADLQRFDIAFDHFTSTHSATNQALVEHIYSALQQRGDIECRSIEQLFDPIKNMFLPERFVKGECPKCHTAEQYGDSCESCGAVYNPAELNNPRSVLSGATPISKVSEHYFFKLTHYTEALQQWTRDGHLPLEVSHKLDEWFTAGLKDWDISRDAPYFGFKIPNTTDKYFYVWLDAPICYIAACQELCAAKQLDFDAFWRVGSDIELYHFIGKDIVYFHALFWPAMLMGAGYRTPTALMVHGMLTVDGQKMSKSRGTFIKAATYLAHLDPTYLRYYYASKLSAQVSDIDFNREDFRLRVNADLVGKVVNIASRCAAFIAKNFDNTLASQLSSPSLYATFANAGDSIGRHYEALNFSRAVREIMLLADQANYYIDAEKPWQAIKDPARWPHVHEVCSLGLNLFRLLMLYLQPVLPAMAEQVNSFLPVPLSWNNRHQPLLSIGIAKFKPLLQRVEVESIAAMDQASQAT